ncbi:MAG: LytR C-terminal domain-containing protein [Candidatus Cloacimonetes bacterium]|nr:LytR C-terminal domain-containing protein [Candidatus Cloacimonadota bacterium]
MRKSKNNLLHINKVALLIVILTLLLILTATYFLFFQKKVIVENDSEFTEMTSLKLAILNGCGVQGAASKVKDHFINQNYENIDIIFWENVRSSKFIYGKSIIVVKRRNESKLKYLMKITGISRRIYALDDNSIEDLQIILGRDFRAYFK